MTILLLHALPLDERMWEPQRTAFGDVVAPRLYGRGASMEEWARSILGEVEGELVAVGASMGGYCALELVRQAPERVRGLVLAGAPGAGASPGRRGGGGGRRAAPPPPGGPAPGGGRGPRTLASRAPRAP